jgi:hypothetical protein
MEFCIIFEYLSLGKGSFTGHWGRLEHFCPSTLGFSLPTWKWVECPGWRCCYGCEMQNSKKSTVMDFNLCSSVRLDILSCSFTLKSYLTNWYLLKTGRLRKIMLSEQSCRSPEKIVLSGHSCKRTLSQMKNILKSWKIFILTPLFWFPIWAI